MSSQKLKKWTPYLLTAPSLLVVVLFVIYPILNSVFRSFQNKETGGFTLEHYQYFLTDPLQQSNILYTLKIVLWTVLITLVFSYLLALYLRFSGSRLSKWMGMLTLLPRFIPGLVAVYAVILVIRDSGVINRLGMLVGQEWQLGWMFNEKGIILMNIWFNIPFSTLIIFASLSGIQQSIIESAKDVGASKWQIFRSMILPLSYKDALVAVTFTFMGNVGSFTTPFLMGGNSPKMLGIALYDQFNSYMDYERAAALSVLMFLICSLSAVVYIYSNLKEKEWEKRA
ncbi:ABC transporter permease [Atopococcus tabaci]|uniref:ABC transporter permease n=1 Tax=Atopococcus tabaci TaxID=269774 RepID=UPI0003F7975F|nr:ABC transporter permease [Atopococcus tabaci]